MSSLQTRINELFAAYPDRTNAQLARYLGISRATITHWRNGTTQKIDGDHAFGVARFFGVSPEWVQTGNGQKTIIEQKQQRTYAHDAVFLIPIIEWSQIVNWTHNINSIIPNVKNWLPCPESSCGRRTFAITVKDDSMINPMPGHRSYPINTILFVDPDREPSHDSRVLASVADDMVFREYRKDGGRIVLTAYNPKYLAHDVTDQVVIFGVVVGQYMPD